MVNEQNSVNLLDKWTDTSCKHERTDCGVYGHALSMACSLCGNMIMFKLNLKTESFRVSFNLGAVIGEVPYKEAISLINVSMKRFSIPDGMGADPMSEYAEEDAQHLMELLEVLTQNGLLGMDPPDITASKFDKRRH